MKPEQGNKVSNRKKSVITILLILVLIICILVSLVLLSLNNQDTSGESNTSSSSSSSTSQTTTISTTTPSTASLAMQPYSIPLPYYNGQGVGNKIELELDTEDELVISKKKTVENFDYYEISGDNFILSLYGLGSGFVRHSEDHTMIGTSSLGDIYEFPLTGNSNSFGYTNTLKLTDAECNVPSGTGIDTSKPCRTDSLEIGSYGVTAHCESSTNLAGCRALLLNLKVKN